MKKVLFVHRYGEKWKCSIHLVEDRIAEKALRFSRQKKWDLAYKVVSQNDLATEKLRMRKDWNSLETVDILLAYFWRF